MPITPEEYQQALRGQSKDWVAPEALGSSYWPSQNDVAFAHKYDATYGSPNAPNVKPGAANVANTSFGAADDWFNKINSGVPMRAPFPISGHLNTQEDANRAMAEHLAANRSAVAQLGYDPSLSVSTPAKVPGTLSRAGAYNPQSVSNMSWYDQAHPSAAMHESMHRALNMLRQKGNNIPVGQQEEAYVRALMNRAYGNVELKEIIPPGGVAHKGYAGTQQMEKGYKMRNDPIVDQLEALAAAEIARKHPGGPR